MASVTRRGFLAAAGAAVAATVGAGCASGASALTGPSPTRPPAAASPPSTPRARTTTPPDWAALRARLDGRLVLRGEAGFATEAEVFNAALDPRPVAVARCASADEVVACLDLAAGAGLPVAARSGGHSYPGYSSPDDGLVVDLRPQAQVRVREDGTVAVGAGARLIEVYAALAAAGRALPAGSCPSVGIGGLLLGGGIGVLTRAYGLTCDRLVSATVVTGGGSLLSASAEDDPDLFWALRGGGGGTVGMVTEFVLRTEPAPDLTVFRLRFPTGAAASVIGAWQEWAPRGPDELWSACAVSAGTPPSARVTGCFVGSPQGVGPLLDRLVSAAGVRPTDRFANARSYLDAMRYFAGCSQRTVAACHLRAEGGDLERMAFRASSRVLAAPLDGVGLSRLVDVVTGPPGLDLLIDALGGAAGRVGVGDTAFPHRTALATVQVYQGGRDGDRVRRVESALAGVVGAGAYVNYLDPGQRDWADASYGPNLARLKAVAARYDPDRVLDFPQNVQRA